MTLDEELSLEKYAPGPNLGRTILSSNLGCFEPVYAY